MFDGSILASYGNVIVITINYRLGVLGKDPTALYAESVTAVMFQHNISVPAMFCVAGFLVNYICRGLSFLASTFLGLLCDAAGFIPDFI